MEIDVFNVSSKGKQKCYEVDYTTLAQQDVEHIMREDVDHICGIFGVEVSRFLKSTAYPLTET